MKKLFIQILFLGIPLFLTAQIQSLLEVQADNGDDAGLYVNGQLSSVARIANKTNNGLFLQLKDNGGSTTHMLRSYGDSYINTGNFGVGTTQPQSLFEVQAAAGSAGTLTLSNKELTVVNGDVFGQINFNTPFESDGSVANQTSASIWAEADATFNTATNRSALIFATADSGTVTETMKLSRTNLQLTPTTGISFAIYGMGTNALNIFSGDSYHDAGSGITFYGNASSDFASDIKLRSIGNDGPGGPSGDKVAWYHANTNRWDWRGIPFSADITVEADNGDDTGLYVNGQLSSVAKLANSLNNGMFFQLRDEANVTTHHLRSYGDSFINKGNLGIGTIDPKSKLQVSDGDIYIEDINKGVIMKSQDGQCWRYTPNNSGQLIPTAISCPN